MRTSVPQELRVRLDRDCAAHAQKVRELVLAKVSGQLEPEIALRSIALELHSVKGAASVLGLTKIEQLIGPLCQAMLQRENVSDASFWLEYETWFKAVVSCVAAQAAGDFDDALMEVLTVRRERLLETLGKEPSEVSPSRHVDAQAMLSPSAGRRVLIIDDSATVRAAMSARLSHRGYPVRAAKNLAETKQLLADFEPEIVITDVHMPDVEGDALCRQIKSHMTRVVPVLLYSGLPETELRARATAAAADAYVCKSAGIEGLIRRMDELLSDEILF